MTVDVTLSQAITILQEEGYELLPYQVHYLVNTGKITRPAKDGAGTYRFTIKILEDLMKNEYCVGDIQKCLSVSQPNASQHLKILREAGIIESRREKNRICYRIADDRIIKILETFEIGE